MRFMILIPASKESEAGALPSEDLLRELGKFNEEMANAGILRGGEGLHPSSKGARIKFSGGKTTVIDGPFTESKELVAGFWLIEVKSREEAIAWMKRAPFGDGTTLELRQVFETEDFGDALPPDVKKKEEEVWAKVEQRS